MAYLPKRRDDSGSIAPAAPTGTGPGPSLSPVQQPARTAPVPQKGGSNLGYVDINRYMSQNRQQAGDLAERIGQNVLNQSNQARTGIRNAGQQFGQEVGAGTVNFNKPLLERSVKDPTSIVDWERAGPNYVPPAPPSEEYVPTDKRGKGGNQHGTGKGGSNKTPPAPPVPAEGQPITMPSTANEIKDQPAFDEFQKQYNAQYTGPQDVRLQDYYQPVLEDISNAQRSSALIGTESGRKELIGNLYNEPIRAPGMWSLDNLLLQQKNPRYILEQAQGGAVDLPNVLDTMNTDAAAKVQQGEKISDLTRLGYRTAFMGPSEALSEDQVKDLYELYTDEPWNDDVGAKILDYINKGGKVTDPDLQAKIDKLSADLAIETARQNKGGGKNRPTSTPTLPPGGIPYDPGTGVPPLNGGPKQHGPNQNPKAPKPVLPTKAEQIQADLDFYNKQQEYQNLVDQVIPKDSPLYFALNGGTFNKLETDINTRTEEQQKIAADRIAAVQKQLAAADAFGQSSAVKNFKDSQGNPLYLPNGQLNPQFAIKNIPVPKVTDEALADMGLTRAQWTKLMQDSVLLGGYGVMAKPIGSFASYGDPASITANQVATLPEYERLAAMNKLTGESDTFINAPETSGQYSTDMTDFDRMSANKLISSELERQKKEYAARFGYSSDARALGAGAGAVTGLATGALIGTYIWPGVGTVIGAVVGAIVGALVGLFCPIYNTPILMEDGSWKMVQDLRIGDRTMYGGVVMGVGEVMSNDIWTIDGVSVSGNHVFFDGFKWVRAKECKFATRVEFEQGQYCKVYPIMTETHILITGGLVSRDFVETNEATTVTDAERIAILNNPENDYVNQGIMIIQDLEKNNYYEVEKFENFREISSDLH